MATVTQFGWWDPRLFYLDIYGDVVLAAGHTLYQYQNGTTTNQSTYSDPAGTVANPNPITLDSEGRAPPMFGVVGQTYTFAIKNASGATVKTFDNVSPMPVSLTGSYVPLSGGAMTGLLYLSGAATSGLGAVTKAQMDAADAATLASATTIAAAATAAAAAATAAAAAIKPQSWFLANASGSSASLVIPGMPVGTYNVTLYTSAHKTDPGSGTYSHNITQSATVGSTTVNTSFYIGRAGGSGYGARAVRLQALGRNVGDLSGR